MSETHLLFPPHGGGDLVCGAVPSDRYRVTVLVGDVTCRNCLAEAGHLHPYERPGWDTWAIGIAQAVSTRADCRRRQVGAVVLDVDHRLIGAGYNGSPPGGPSCLAGQCPRGLSGVAPLSSYSPDGPGACHALHAEKNAIVDAGRRRTKGGTIYVTCQPCYMCRLDIQAGGIVRAVWLEDGEIVDDRLAAAGGDGGVGGHRDPGVVAELARALLQEHGPKTPDDGVHNHRGGAFT